MELEELKTIFTRSLALDPAEESANNFRLRINEKSSAPVAMIRRNLQREATIALLFSAFPVFILIQYHGLFISAFAVISLVIIADFCISIRQQLKAIQRFERRSHAIVQHHRLLIQILSKFTRLYLRSTLLLPPVFFVSAFILVHLDNIRKDPLLFRITYENTVGMYTVICIVWTVLLYFFTKWYLRKLYGKHLQKIKLQLHELEQL